VYMYISVVVASESLKATSGGEASQPLYTLQMNEMCRDEENRLMSNNIYGRDSHSGEVVSVVMQKMKNPCP
jgi:hypothetical protein